MADFDPNYIDPAVGIPLALVAWTVYGVIVFLERRS